MTAFLSDALALAASSLVIPLEPRGKRPVAGLGLRHATQDPETIEHWWGQWPDANIGMRCDGLLVVDVDGDTGERSLEQLQGRFGALPVSRAVKTGKGRHLLYSADVAGNSTRPLGSPAGIDLRGGSRGYVVAPSSIHPGRRRYEWIDERPPVPLPGGWLRVLAGQVHARQPLAADQVLELGEETRYGRAALERELERLWQAGPGARNETLNLSVFKLAQLAGGGHLQLAQIERETLDVALAIGLERTEAVATIGSAIQGGLRSPRASSPSRARADSSKVKTVEKGDSTFSTDGEISSLSSLTDLGGKKVNEVVKLPRAREAKTVLDLFDESRPRRRKRQKRAIVPHIRHGRFPRAIERMLERETPELLEHDEAELERLLAKHADIAEAANPQEQRVVPVVPVATPDSGNEAPIIDLERARQFDEMYPPKRTRVGESRAKGGKDDKRPICLICERPYTPSHPCALRCDECREKSAA